MELEAVIFDVDGTLADTERDGHRPGVEDAIRDIHARKSRHFLAQLDGGGIPLRPGIARLLAEARQRGLHLAIATTTTADNVIGLLRRLELGPGAWLALEDSANGLAASLGAGIVTVVLVNEYARHQAFSGAVTVLFDLGEAGTPCRVLAGDAGEQGLVDVDLLRRWHHLGSIPVSGGCN